MDVIYLFVGQCGCSLGAMLFEAMRRLGDLSEMGLTRFCTHDKDVLQHVRGIFIDTERKVPAASSRLVSYREPPHPPHTTLLDITDVVKPAQVVSKVIDGKVAPLCRKLVITDRCGRGANFAYGHSSTHSKSIVESAMELVRKEAERFVPNALVPRHAHL